MTLTAASPPRLMVGLRAMSDIERLVDEGRQSRIDTAQLAAEARQALDEAQRQLRKAGRAYVDAWDTAAAAGWTTRELRALKLPEPPAEFRPRPRAKRKPRTET